MTQRNEPDLISSWAYDNCGATSKGKLCSATSGNHYTRNHTYDHLGRPSSTTSNQGAAYIVSTTYDGNTGRPSTLAYPVTGLTVQNNYNAHGYLQSVANASSGLVYWQALSVSATGKILQEKQGNNVITNRSYDATGRITGISAVNASSVTLQNLSTTYDTIGNVTQRTDHVYGTENFTYDALNRLLSASGAPSQNVPAKTVTYDALGNITNKSDVGTYSYGTSSNGVIWRPHAVASVTGGASQSAATYDYDQNGSLIQRTYASGKHHTLEYTSFNRVKKVTGYYSGSLIEGTVEFIFNAEHQRVRQIRTKDGITTTTEYVHPDNQGGLLFERVTIGSSVTYKHYISGGSGTTAVVITGAENRTEYWHKDHLGSIVVLSNESGTEISGSRRYVDAWGLYKPTGPSATGNRGYTGHEHIDFDIVHMNGRTYDPILGRMMGADPIIQHPLDVMDYNRYIYCANNSVICTDPSGYLKLGGIIKAVAIAVAAYFTAGAVAAAFIEGATTAALASSTLSATTAFASAGIGLEAGALTGLGGFLSGAAGGFTAGVPSGGGLEGGLKGALTGGLFGAVGASFEVGSFGSYAGHAAAGCVSGEVNGGGCGRGAATAFAGKLATNYTDGSLVATVVAGGTVSVIGGGKFANGALTAGFGYLFNCGLNPGCWNGAATGVVRALQSAYGRLQILAGEVTASPVGRFVVDLMAGEAGMITPAAGGASRIFENAVERGIKDIQNGVLRQYIHALENDIVVLVRRDFDQFSHGRGNHWNLQVFHDGRELTNIHVNVNAQGLPISALDTKGVWNNGKVHTFSLVDQIPK